MVELGVTIVDILEVVDSRGRGVENGVRWTPRISELGCRHLFKLKRAACIVFHGGGAASRRMMLRKRFIRFI